MQRDELLNMLARELAVWPKSDDKPFHPGVRAVWFQERGYWFCHAPGDPHGTITEEEWRQERESWVNQLERQQERLLNDAQAGKALADQYSAPWFLEQGLKHMAVRASTYDKQAMGGERSMQACVNAFIAITGDGQIDTAERGWMFMVLLKLTRSQQGQFKADNYEDAAAYCGLMGESAAAERAGHDHV